MWGFVTLKATEIYLYRNRYKYFILYLKFCILSLCLQTAEQSTEVVPQQLKPEQL